MASPYNSISHQHGYPPTVPPLSCLIYTSSTRKHKKCCLNELIRKLQTKSHLPHMYNDPIASNIPYAQLSPLLKLGNPFPRWHLKKNIIPNWKLQIRPSPISITLLSALCSLQSLTDSLNKYGSLEHNITDPHNYLTCLPQHTRFLYVLPYNISNGGIPILDWKLLL